MQTYTKEILRLVSFFTIFQVSMNFLLKNRVLLFIFILFSACSPKENGAQERLNNARKFYSEKKYDLAKKEIDSIKIIYPKSFDQIKQGLVLLDSVRRGENLFDISFSDSVIAVRQKTLDSLKRYFVYQIDKKYQDKGFYIAKEIASSGQITATTLRSGVNEDGSIYLESIFIGSQKHNRIKVASKESHKESLTLSNADDGFVHRFSNLGNQYETLRFTGASENGVSQFVAENKNKALTITLDGQGKYSYVLSQPIKNAIEKAYNLSNIIQELDSLKTKKEQAEYKNYYLDNKF